MKTNKHFIPNFKTTIAAALMSLMVFTVGCEKKSDNPVAVAPSPYGAYGGVGCTNCFGNPQLLLGGVRSETPSQDGFMTLDILGGSAIPMNDWLALTYYSGSVAVQGVLRITGQSYNFCNVPAGDYQVRTITAGQMSQKSLSGVIMEGIGPSGARIVMRMYRGVLVSPSSYGNGDVRLDFAARLDFVNGQACGDVVFY